MQQCFWQGTEHVFDDVFEMCGGNARVSILLIKRRHYQVGPNFDAVVGIDLLQPEQISALWQYVEHCKPIFGVLAPPCIGMKAFSALNRLMALDAWHRS
eukprot:4982241-Prorocentrum_lima.AAC.1